MAWGGGIGCKPKSQPDLHVRQPEAQVYKGAELSQEEQAKFQERRKAEIKEVKALYDLI